MIQSNIERSQDNLALLDQKIDRVAVHKAFAELETFRNESFSIENVKAWILEFENLGFSTSDAVLRIQKARYTKQFGNTKFSDFIDQAVDELIPMNLVYKKAKSLFEHNDQKLNELCLRVFDKNQINLNETERENLKYILIEYQNVSQKIPKLREMLQTEEDLNRNIINIRNNTAEIVKLLNDNLKKDIIQMFNEIKDENPKFADAILRMKLEKIVKRYIDNLKISVNLPLK